MLYIIYSTLDFGALTLLYIYIYIYLVIHNSYIIKENDKNLEIIVQSSIPKKAQRCERKMIRKFRS